MDLIAWGEIVPAIPDTAASGRLQELLKACRAHQHVDVVELRRVGGHPERIAIVVDIGDGTVAPGNAIGIRRVERLALSFLPGLDMPLEVRALRRDFPANTLHQNYVPSGEPRSLCLYDLPWSTVERTWTPQNHLRQVLRWLEKTADGTLHEDDQALEQLFFNTGYEVVVPARLATATSGEPIALHLARVVGPTRTLVIEEGQETASGAIAFDFVPVWLGAIGHPPVQAPPQTLGGLQDQLSELGSSLFPSLLEAVRSRGGSGIGVSSPTNSRRVFLLANIPRVAGGTVKRVDVRGFMLDADLARLGVALDVLRLDGATAFSFELVGMDAPTAPASTHWRGIELLPVDVKFSPDPAMARVMSGIDDSDADFRGFLAGSGALGSVLVDLWTREGWGRWDCVDPDVLEPHNPVRHVLSVANIGQAKAEAMRQHLDGIFGLGSSPPPAAIVASANAPDHSEIEAALARARLVVDATATIDVPRDFSEREVPRVASAFLTPSGQAAVLLMEDAQRRVRVSALEAQYYRAVLNQPWGVAHLQAGGLVRTGNGCRDRSLILSNELIQLHGAQLARRIRKAASSSDAQIGVWTLEDETGGVAFHSVPVLDVRSCDCTLWQVRWDAGLEQKLQQMRRDAFPIETGGVLVGVVDQKLRTIHLVDGWPAPVDSDADETGFTRGGKGVLDMLDACHARTKQMVGYIGEWHSHPPGHTNRPSHLDYVLLATLASRLSEDAVPAVMAIAGENGLGVTVGATVDTKNLREMAGAAE